MTVMTAATEPTGPHARTLGLPLNRPLTRADLETLPEDGHRYELIDGTLIVSPAPRPLHQRALGELFVAMRRVCPDDHEVFFAPLDVVLSDDSVIEPDLLVAPKAQFTDRELPGAPLLAVEVLSPSTRGVDLLLKKDRLQRAGCPHYWVIDADGPSITAWALDNDEYRQVDQVKGTDSLDLTDPFPVSIVPQALIDG